MTDLPLTGLGDLAFRFPFRKYQSLALAALSDDTDLRHHIVAPPGSGKTILGIELIRRRGRPAVVFSPTSTIAGQWVEKVEMFLPEGTSGAAIAGSDPAALRPINSFTYQLIAVPGDVGGLLAESAAAEWAEELIDSGREVDLTAAKARIAQIERANPESHEAEIRRHVTRLRKRFLTDPEFDATRIIHPNARALIDALVAYGVGTVVLDESHHLLDYWALVLRTLLARLDDVQVIALTATPPLEAEREAMENYIAIAGEIDFEVPTPAVVKEGNLAPYQDLVYICRPTERERGYIKTVDKRFNEAVGEVAARPDFRAWVSTVLTAPTDADGRPLSWEKAFERDPSLCIAAGRFAWNQLEGGVPETVVLLPEMEDPLDPEDWAYLIAGFGLRHLKLSDRDEDHRAYAELKQLFTEFGYALTEAGLRRRRAPADRILAYSDAKNGATVEILKAEIGALGDELRACVITDFEKESAAARSLAGVLDPDAGGAVRAFRAIVADPETNRPRPRPRHRDDGADRRRRGRTGQGRRWRAGASARDFGSSSRSSRRPHERVSQLVGSGSDWSPGVYVRMITELFGEGVTRCLVGTRGLLGEGWDSLPLNTLVDLTSVTTSVTVNQVRGRSIRLDPDHPDKVADNWDVVCIEPEFAGGGRDLERLFSKHARFYGVSAKGIVARGAIGLDPDLARVVMTHASKPLLSLESGELNRRMLRRASERAKAYERWKVGDPYQNLEIRATKLDVRDLKFRTAHTMRDSVKAMLRALVWMIGAIAASVGAYASPLADDSPLLVVGLVVAAVLFFILTSRQVYALLAHGVRRAAARLVPLRHRQGTDRGDARRRPRRRQPLGRQRPRDPGRGRLLRRLDRLRVTGGRRCVRAGTRRAARAGHRPALPDLARRGRHEPGLLRPAVQAHDPRRPPAAREPPRLASGADRARAQQGAGGAVRRALARVRRRRRAPLHPHAGGTADHARAAGDQRAPDQAHRLRDVGVSHERSARLLRFASGGGRVSRIP